MYDHRRYMARTGRVGQPPEMQRLRPLVPGAPLARAAAESAAVETVIETDFASLELRVLAAAFQEKK